MAHTCAICSLAFNQFFLYQIHMEHDHKNRAMPSHEKPKTKALTKEAKAVIVNKLETRLGKKHFYGSLA